jgi:ParB family chromosome partitioning protein
MSALDASAERLQDELEKLEEADDGDDAQVQQRIAEIEMELTRIDDELSALEASLNDWPDEVKAHAGAIVTLSSSGTPHLLRGFVRAEDRAAATAAEKTATPAAPGKPKEPTEPAAVVLSLSAHRTGILQSAFARQPDVALRVLAFHLASAELYREGYNDPKDYSLLDLRVTEHASDRSRVGHDYDAMPAASDYDLIRDRLMERLPADADDAALWQFFLNCPAELVQETIAVALAPALDGLRRYPNRPDTSGPLAVALEAHDGAMVAMWEPTRANYLGKLPKSLILRAVSEARGPETALEFAKLKRDPLIDAAERSLTGTGWLPPAMRSPVTPAAEAQPDDDSSEAAAA